VARSNTGSSSPETSNPNSPLHEAVDTWAAQDHQRWPDHRGRGGEDKNSWLLAHRHRQHGPMTSPDVQLSLKIGILTHGCISVDKPKRRSMMIRPIAKLSEMAAARMARPFELRVKTMGFRHCLAAKGQQTLCLDAVFKAHVRPNQLQASWADASVWGNRLIEMDQPKVGRP
jgi:hypothetical protein